MNIHAEEGTKVKYTGTGGYDEHRKHANKYLKVGETYTVLNTNVSGWHTSVFLQEVPNQCFNSVHFEELTQHYTQLGITNKTKYYGMDKH